MITVKNKSGVHRVPCGKCAFCLVAKRSAWMFRIHHEMRNQDKPGWFLTLTYDEKHVPRVRRPTKEDPEGKVVRLSLRFRDVQLFLKRLRKEKFYAKYICVGEYGPETLRPHYHIIVWTDATVEAMERAWFYGRIHYGRLSMASAMYTLKYIIQPKPPAYEGVERPRAQFSKGLGLAYLGTDWIVGSQMMDYHNPDGGTPNFHSVVDGRKVALPRYYRNKIFSNAQQKFNGSKVKWESIRRRRETMRVLLKRGVSNTKSYIQRLRCEEALTIIKSTKFNQSL